MSRITAVLDELDALERVQTALAGITANDDHEDRRVAFVGLRKKLSAQMSAVGTLVDALFASAPLHVQREYRGVYSRMRSSAALHQAEWPAVRLYDDLAEYQASARSVREMNRQFLTWMRTTLADPAIIERLS